MGPMDLSKIYEFLKPEDCKGRINIVGCGSVGSTVAENLVRCGFKKITLWDFDMVEKHNIVNQMFTDEDIGKPKVEALARILTSINPSVEDDLILKPKGWEGQSMSGYIFLCVDSIEIRRDIVEKHLNNSFVEAVFDFRTALTGAQHFAANWKKKEDRNNLLDTMQFSHEEAQAEAPVSACGVTLGVATTVRIISALGVNNFINLVKGEALKRVILMDGFDFVLDAF